MDILFLSGSDVNALLNFDLAFEANREAYRASGLKWAMSPPIVSLDLASWNGEIDIKSGYSGFHELVGIKMMSSFWDNERNYGLPASMGLICLFDSRNGQPLCILPANDITYYRTAAAGAYAATLLARADAKVMAIIGTGGLARMHLAATMPYFDIREVNVWGRNSRSVREYVSEMQALYPVLEFRACVCVEDAVHDADIIATATPSHEALIMKGWVKPGVHINAFGSDMPGKQELDAELTASSKLVVDSVNECCKRGETQHALKAGLLREDGIYSEIGQITLGKKHGRENAEEITVFDSVGISIQDISMVSRMYNEAREKGLGQIVHM